MHGHLSDPAGRPQNSDRLSEVLQDLRIARAAYCRSELTRPWGIDLPFEEGVRFHFVVEGGCWLITQAQAPIWMEAGDVVLLPHGTGHAIADDPASPRRETGEASASVGGGDVYRLRMGGGGDRSLIVCCSVGFDAPAAHPLIALMPEVLMVRRAERVDPTLRAVLDLMAAETGNPRLGAATLMSRLADIVITQVVRAWAESHAGELTGWIAAIRDPQVGLALAAIHRAPGAAWTVEALARTAGLSRSLFSERFTALLGVAPAKYLSQWRMHLASVWLQGERVTVAEVAARLGYESDASFSRAFKRTRGVPPSRAGAD